MTDRSQVQSPALCVQVATLGKLFVYMCLSSSKKFGTWQEEVMPCRRLVGLALHWPCIPDFSGLSTYGLTA